MQCAKKLGIDFSVISVCMNSKYGNHYEHDMALLTESLDPRLTYVPWITVNWVCVHSCFLIFIAFMPVGYTSIQASLCRG